MTGDTDRLATLALEGLLKAEIQQFLDRQGPIKIEHIDFQFTQEVGRFQKIHDVKIHVSFPEWTLE